MHLGIVEKIRRKVNMMQSNHDFRMQSDHDFRMESEYDFRSVPGDDEIDQKKEHTGSHNDWFGPHSDIYTVDADDGNTYEVWETSDGRRYIYDDEGNRVG